MGWYEEYLPVLRGWFGRRLRNQADIDDAVQDVWLKLQGRINEEGISNIQPYLFNTAQSVLVDRARRASVRQEHAHSELKDFHHPVEVLTPERVLMGKQAMAGVMARVQNLPERTRRVFVLHRFDSLSYGEIARSMDISVSAVEKHIMKALHLLMDERP